MQNLIYAAVAFIMLGVIIIQGALVTGLREDLERLVNCHNSLAELTRRITEALNSANIPAPEVRNHKTKEEGL